MSAKKKSKELTVFERDILITLALAKTMGFPVLGTHAISKLLPYAQNFKAALYQLRDNRFAAHETDPDGYEKEVES